MTRHDQQRLLEQLRGLVPQRPLGSIEARRIAELQATRLLKTIEASEPAIVTDAISDALGISVERHNGLPSSGLTTQTQGGWIIVLSADEATNRARFSLVHEIKHILDDPFIEWLYRPSAGQSAELIAERICDCFAAAVLMPKAWIKRDWGNGHQNLRSLAARYSVSMAAMSYRLGELRLAGIDIGHNRSSIAVHHHYARRIAP